MLLPPAMVNQWQGNICFVKHCKIHPPIHPCFSVGTGKIKQPLIIMLKN